MESNSVASHESVVDDVVVRQRCTFRVARCALINEKLLSVRRQLNSTNYRRELNVGRFIELNPALKVVNFVNETRRTAVDGIFQAQRSTVRRVKLSQSQDLHFFNEIPRFGVR